MDLNTANHIYCVGIGGIGISGLAQLLYWQGKPVSGSDLASSIITESLRRDGIPVVIGEPEPSHLPAGADCVIYSLAIQPDHPELREAKSRGVVTLSYPEAVGQYTRNKYLIAVSGTHGKTTATAMLGQVLVEAGFDPTVLVGSRLAAFNGNVRLGKSKYFVLEADEFGRAFLQYHPDMAILNNIEADHLDVYTDVEDIEKTFQKYVSQVKPDGWLVANADDPRIESIIKKSVRRTTSFGIGDGEYRGTLEQLVGEVVFTEPHVGRVVLQVPGRHNVMNALAVIAASQLLRIKPSVVKKALENFHGLWRRFEIVGQCQGAPVISDYAHHPTAFRVTLQAAREYYPEKKIIAVFQPHHRHRTKALYDEFLNALELSDELILAEIYDVAGREDNTTVGVSSRQLVEDLKKRKVVVSYAKDIEIAETLARQKATTNSVILVMGAGTIDAVARNLVDKNNG
ncbi:MAG: UDP-N-acetylmuramate--L-alanine ligase [Patescibacteria group bacterium]